MCDVRGFFPFFQTRDQKTEQIFGTIQTDTIVQQTSYRRDSRLLKTPRDSGCSIRTRVFVLSRDKIPEAKRKTAFTLEPRCNNSFNNLGNLRWIPIVFTQNSNFQALIAGQNSIRNFFSRWTISYVRLHRRQRHNAFARRAPFDSSVNSRDPEIAGTNRTKLHTRLRDRFFIYARNLSRTNLRATLVPTAVQTYSYHALYSRLSRETRTRAYDKFEKFFPNVDRTQHEIQPRVLRITI